MIPTMLLIAGLSDSIFLIKILVKIKYLLFLALSSQFHYVELSLFTSQTNFIKQICLHFSLSKQLILYFHYFTLVA